MSLIVSAPGGVKIIGARVLLFTTLGWCLLPALFGTIGGLILDSRAPGGYEAATSGWRMLMYLLFVSPLITAPFWLAVTIGTALFARRGFYGSLVAVVTGVAAGGAAAYGADAPALVALGAILATFHRFTLALLRPEAF